MKLEFIPLKQTKRGKPTILFSKSGLISLSKTATEELKITKENRIELARDQERPEDWYMVAYPPGSERGVPFREKDKTFALNASSWTHAFLDQFSEDGKSLTVLLSTTPIEEGEKKSMIYAILTKSLKKKE